MKIVLTGGPAAGKTSLALILEKTYADKLAIVPEAASILFRGGFPREPSEAQRKCQQKAIYYVQRELENSIELSHPGEILICDRGSLDALAYWPGPAEEFLQSMQTSLAAEVARYDWVIHLETARAPDYKNSAIRTETSREALDIDAKVKAAWQKHPNQVIIPRAANFPMKIYLAIKIVRSILECQGCDFVRRMIESEALEG